MKTYFKGSSKEKVLGNTVLSTVSQTDWEAELQLHAFLTSERNSNEWLTSRPSRFVHDKKCYPWKGSWVGPGLDVATKRKNQALPGIETRSPRP
jgi:hypothetical protein